tara:strand:+ start:151 stop:975 length:825 start_codon:yes stop_codon:yes gene_type:complete
MSRSHNKKRNVGIIYEQIINFICNSLIEENKVNAEKATQIIKKHFRKETQLYKEYKLFKALATTNNISDQLASSIIQEAKKACNSMFNNEKLEKEKSFLIKDLNYQLGKGIIFEEKVKNYRIYATIQTLLNEWRKNSSNFDKKTEYEIKLHRSLTESAEVKSKVFHKVDPLTYKIMNKMFDEKYSVLLNENQKSLISNFIKEDEESLSKEFYGLKKTCLNVLESYINNCKNSILIEKHKIIKNQILNLNENNLSKENLQKFLIVSKLKEELLGE